MVYVQNFTLWFSMVKFILLYFIKNDWIIYCWQIRFNLCKIRPCTTILAIIFLLLIFLSIIYKFIIKWFLIYFHWSSYLGTYILKLASGPNCQFNYLFYKLAYQDTLELNDKYSQLFETMSKFTAIYNIMCRIGKYTFYLLNCACTIYTYILYYDRIITFVVLLNWIIAMITIYTLEV